MTNPTKEPMTNPKYQVWVVGADGVVKVTFWNLEAEAARDMVAACLKDCDGGATLSVRLMAKAEEALAGEARRVTYGEEKGGGLKATGVWSDEMTNEDSGATLMTSKARQRLGEIREHARSGKMTSDQIRAAAKELAGQWPEVKAKLLAEQWTEEERQGWLHGEWSEDQSRN